MVRGRGIPSCKSDPLRRDSRPLLNLPWWWTTNCKIFLHLIHNNNNNNNNNNCKKQLKFMLLLHPYHHLIIGMASISPGGMNLVSLWSGLGTDTQLARPKHCVAFISFRPPNYNSLICVYFNRGHLKAYRHTMHRLLF